MYVFFSFCFFRSFFLSFLLPLPSFFFFFFFPRCSCAFSNCSFMAIFLPLPFVSLTFHCTFSPTVRQVLFRKTIADASCSNLCSVCLCVACIIKTTSYLAGFKPVSYHAASEIYAPLGNTACLLLSVCRPDSISSSDLFVCHPDSPYFSVCLICSSVHKPRFLPQSV